MGSMLPPLPALAGFFSQLPGSGASSSFGGAGSGLPLPPLALGLSGLTFSAPGSAVPPTPAELHALAAINEKMKLAQAPAHAAANDASDLRAQLQQLYAAAQPDRSAQSPADAAPAQAQSPQAQLLAQLGQCVLSLSSSGPQTWTSGDELQRQLVGYLAQAMHARPASSASSPSNNAYSAEFLLRSAAAL